MALDGIAAAAPPGVHGFDCADIVSADQAAQFLAVGFGFCIRYLSRNDAQGPNGLSAEEEASTQASPSWQFSMSRRRVGSQPSRWGPRMGATQQITPNRRSSGGHQYLARPRRNQPYR